ncbi:molybdopterin synthase sulfur carrier subunit [Nephila pilipes]|uniref:Molybdopterin synthase sulfur carrier subunit n=1 Tax=Nephila pilipes TaxID=299642 RepID=A0A8X6NNJ0_NEPPI|nr:molybdopterin synthase sulfur carrier subunit [Nephila pilipes]
MQDNKVSIKLLFFAKARELMGKHEMEAQLPPGPYNSQRLLQKLLSTCEDLQPIAENIILAINEEYIDKLRKIHLKDGDQIAVIPPLSGG